MNGLSTISMIQALDVWTDLVEAGLGRHGYGGDVAEIYLYRLLSHDPLIPHDERREERAVARYREANRALHALCRAFETRTGSRIEFEDGEDVDRLLSDTPETHRVHLRIKPNGN